MKKTILKGNPIDTYIRIIILTILLAASYFIVKPFLLIIIWSALVAVALYPFYEKIIKLFKGKKKGLVTTVFILVLLVIIITPTVNLSSSIVDSAKSFKSKFETRTVDIPPPNDKVKEWPLIGERAYNFWSEANKNLENVLRDHKDQLKTGLGKIFSSLTGLLGTVFLALFSLIFAGVFMLTAEGGYSTSIQFANRIKPGKGEELIKMIVNTIRSVVKGILLVAIIQAALAYLGFVVIGLPGAAIFALFVLILGIIQIPALLAMIPAIAIVFSTHDSMPAIIFTVYSLLVALSDNFLKPMLLGKGLQTPMLVILIGALGGMIAMGMLGLFIGPVILAIVHQMYMAWVSEVELPKKVEKVVEE
ncbi:MAG: AI-2E family transporter [Flavobacteriaceae bacterium]|nr:AI-2E family transporter [Flavobacteriaceae bacterium]